MHDRVDALRLTTQPLLDSGADDLIRVTKVDGPQYVGGVRVNPGDSVVDYSALGSGIDGTGIGYEHVIGTGYNDTLISDWSNGHVISGGAGDDHLGSRGGGFGSNDTFVGGDGADTFHLAIEPYMTTPYVLADFNPGDGDRIELLFNSGATDPVFSFSDGQLLVSFRAWSQQHDDLVVATIDGDLSEGEVLGAVSIGNSLGFTQSWETYVYADDTNTVAGTFYGTPGNDYIYTNSTTTL